MYNSFGAISPDLVDNGYCADAFNYGQTIPLSGFYAIGSIGASAADLSAEVNKVLSETGAGKVDIVGWSQAASRWADRCGDRLVFPSRVILGAP